MLVLDGGDLFLRGEFEQLKGYQRTPNFPFLCGNSVHEETGTLLPLETAASPARGRHFFADLASSSSSVT